MDQEWAEVLAEFAVEAGELLDALEGHLVRLEQAGYDADIVSAAFRSLHTVKGSAGFMDLGLVESIAHAGEALLSELRDGSIAVTPEVISDLLACTDAVRAALAGSDDDPSDLIERLRAATGHGPIPAADPPTVPGADSTDSDALDASPPEQATQDGYAAPAAGMHPAAEAAGAPQTPQHDLGGQPQAPDAHPPRPDQAGSATAPPADSAGDGTRLVDDAARHVRVDVDVLDTLMALVGELVLTRGQLRAQLPRGGTTDASVARLGQLTSELQDAVMRTRLQPISILTDKYPRLVRDLARDLGKGARLVVDGAATELDRSLIEALRDPLTHIVRNAVDHGLEAPQVRTAAGKPAEGTIHVSAWHDAGKVVVEIRDDGRGVDLAKVRATAVARGLLSAERAGELTDAEAIDLLFAPGFSTADKVTNVSGRGVGMDVVRSSVERVGGSVTLTSVPGAGSVVRATVPLTVAILPALSVDCAGQRYAISQAAVEELVGTAGLDVLQGVRVLHLRGQVVPVIDLAHELGFGSTGANGIVVVLRNGGTRVGLLVDGAPGVEEVVVKPLDPLLGAVPLYSGATILGDGSVVLILDVGAVCAQVPGLDTADDTVEAVVEVAAVDRVDAVLCTAGASMVAVPTTLVERFEQIDCRDIHTVRGQHVLQYRGSTLPLARLDSHADTARVVVVRHDAGHVGLAVDTIVDVASVVDHGDGSVSSGAHVLELLGFDEIANLAGAY